MKKCNKCGNFAFSKQEKQIYKKLPSTSVEIAESIKSKRKIVLTVLRRLESYGIVREIKKDGRNIIFDKTDITIE